MTDSLCICSIDSTEEDSLGKMFNHSKKNVNVIIKVIILNDKPHLGVVASRDIYIGKELQYDYGERRRDVTNAYPWLLQ